MGSRLLTGGTAKAPPDLSSGASRLALNGTVGAVNLTRGCFSKDCDVDATVE